MKRILLMLALVGCSTAPSTSDKITLAGPAPSDFSASQGGVNPVFEAHCGSFDCHGNPARAMRIYSQNGLRLPNEAGIAPGGAPTTVEEVSANYRSVISVEPEKMNAAVKPGGDPYSLLLLKKPLAVEDHKGGQVMTKESDIEKCISSWIRGGGQPNQTDKGACTTAAIFPKP